MGQIVWIGVKDLEDGGRCILGARSTELGAMKLCIEHNKHHPDYTIESMEVDGDYCLETHGYTSSLLQVEYACRMRALSRGVAQPG